MRSRAVRGSIRAFSILEVMLAIAVVAAVAALSVPVLMGGLDERRGDAALDIVSAHLMLARAESRSSGRPVFIRVDSERGEVVAQFEDEPIEERWAIRVVPGGIAVDGEEGGPWVILLPDGTAAESGTIVCNGRTCTVDSLTGQLQESHEPLEEEDDADWSFEWKEDQ